VITLTYNKETEQAKLEIEGLQENIMEELINAVIDITDNLQGDDPLLEFIQLLVDYKNGINKKEVVM
jgi:hypothetical protein